MANKIMRVFGRASMDRKTLFVMLAIPVIVSAKECTPGVTYLDPVTGNCDPCGDICDQAVQQGTSARCQTLCKGYVGAPDMEGCPPGQYYDTNVRRCDTCRSLCLHPNEYCRRHCPNWGTEASQNSGIKTTTMNISLTPKISQVNGTGSYNMMRNPIFWVLVGGIALLSVCMVGIALYNRDKLMQLVNKCTHRCQRRGELEQQRCPMMTTPTVKDGRGPFATPEQGEMTAFSETVV